MHWTRLAAATALTGLVFFGLSGGAGAADSKEAELKCLALNVYWEARAEPEHDKLAVAYVTLNRVASPDFPKSICAVVKQGGEMKRHACQFSWWCDGKSDVPTNMEQWEESMAVARDALEKKQPDPTGGALFFHNETVKPDWADKKIETASIGQHVYYK